MDSGALDHVTSKMEQLVIKEDYTGCQQLHIGSGEYFKISHKGSIFLPTALSNILKFPKNLLSSSKFTDDNNVTVEFLSNCCFVKDKDTKEVLLQGTLKDSLYQLQYLCAVPHSVGYNTNTVFDFSSRTDSNFTTNKTMHVDESSVCNVFGLQVNKTEISLRHQRLGHPSKKVMRNVFNSMQVSADFANFQFREDCHFGKYKKSQFSSSNSKASKVLELIYSDLQDLALVAFKKVFKYYLHF